MCGTCADVRKQRAAAAEATAAARAAEPGTPVAATTDNTTTATPTTSLPVPMTLPEIMSPSVASPVPSRWAMTSQFYEAAVETPTRLADALDPRTSRAQEATFRPPQPTGARHYTAVLSPPPAEKPIVTRAMRSTTQALRGTNGPRAAVVAHANGFGEQQQVRRHGAAGWSHDVPEGTLVLGSNVASDAATMSQLSRIPCAADGCGGESPVTHAMKNANRTLKVLKQCKLCKDTEVICMGSDQSITDPTCPCKTVESLQAAFQHLIAKGHGPQFSHTQAATGVPEADRVKWAPFMTWVHASILATRNRSHDMTRADLVEFMAKGTGSRHVMVSGDGRWHIRGYNSQWGTYILVRALRVHVCMRAVPVSLDATKLCIENRHSWSGCTTAVRPH